MNKSLVFISILTMLIITAGCKKEEKTEEQTAQTEKPSRVISMDEVTTDMTVEEINLPERLFTLTYDGNNEIVIRAADDLTGLEKIKVGDRVEVTYVKSLAFYVTPYDSARPPMTKTTQVMVDSKGEKPKKFMADVTEKVSTVVALDVANRKATLQDPEGNLRTVDVSPQVQNLENVKVGDQVVFQSTEAFAVDIKKVDQ
jgi:ASC-1-like (ASCH) protein